MNYLSRGSLLVLVVLQILLIGSRNGKIRWTAIPLGIGEGYTGPS